MLVHIVSETRACASGRACWLPPHQAFELALPIRIDDIDDRVSRKNDLRPAPGRTAAYYRFTRGRGQWTLA
eukprot:1405331-Prymnesium_polylepis.2